MEFPTAKLALIREKTTPLFPDNLIACPVLLSGPESELKMTANSTYREADREFDGLEGGGNEGKGYGG